MLLVTSVALTRGRAQFALPRGGGCGGPPPLRRQPPIGWRSSAAVHLDGDHRVTMGLGGGLPSGKLRSRRRGGDRDGSGPRTAQVLGPEPLAHKGWRPMEQTPENAGPWFVLPDHIYRLITAAALEPTDARFAELGRALVRWATDEVESPRGPTSVSTPENRYVYGMFGRHGVPDSIYPLVFRDEPIEQTPAGADDRLGNGQAVDGA